MRHMPHNRFFAPGDWKAGATIALQGKEHHHLSHVMRMRKGEEAELVNGKGLLCHVHIEEVAPQTTFLKILSAEQFPPLSPHITSAIPLMRVSKLEEIVEKGTELGADAFFFYRAYFSEKEAISPHHMERLYAIAISALKQSGRLYLPSLEFFPNLKALLARDVSFFFGHPRSRTFPPLSTLPPSFLFIAGPEKGFSSEELSLLQTRGGQGVLLSPHLLRAETAPLAALAILKTATVLPQKLQGCYTVPE